VEGAGIDDYTGKAGALRVLRAVGLHAAVDHCRLRRPATTALV